MQQRVLESATPEPVIESGVPRCTVSCPHCVKPTSGYNSRTRVCMVQLLPNGTQRAIVRGAPCVPQIIRDYARYDAQARELELRTAMLLMVGSELAGDPKIGPADKGDPRWSPTLEEAAKARRELEAARAELVTTKRALAGLYLAQNAIDELLPKFHELVATLEAHGMPPNVDMSAWIRGRLAPAGSGGGGGEP